MIIGNLSIISFLYDLSDNNKLPPTLLFKGIGGIGKFLVGLQLARRENCTGSKLDDCNCSSCHAFKIEAHQSIKQLRGKLSKEVIRDLSDFISCKSQYKKKFIIIEFDQVDDSSQDILLKMLEEPPSNTHFILVTSSGNVHQTIESRSLCVNFSPCTGDELADFILSEAADKLSLRYNFCLKSESERKLLVFLSMGSIGNLVKLMTEENLFSGVSGFLKTFFTVKWKDCFLQDCEFEPQGLGTDLLGILSVVTQALVSNPEALNYKLQPHISPSKFLQYILDKDRNISDIGKCRKRALIDIYMETH
jgi:hypothetical protein